MEYSGAGGKLIHEKNPKQKISWHCPFNLSDYWISIQNKLLIARLWKLNIAFQL